MFYDILLLGSELFPDKGFNIRLGYSFRRAEELKIIEQRNFSGFSFGVGLKFNKFRFSYTHARYSSSRKYKFSGSSNKFTIVKKITIAIDGFSSTGKSTLAKQLAQKLQYSLCRFWCYVSCCCFICIAKQFN